MSYLGTKPQTATQLASGIVTTESIADGAVGTSDIATSAVTPAKLSTGAPTWDSSGNVGIGTNAPTFPLDVRNSNLNVSKFQQTGSFQPVYMTSTTNLSGVMSETGNQNGLLMNSASNYTTLWSGGAERMRIDSSGNLMVGSTTTQNNNRLYVQSNNFMVGINGTNSSGEMVRFYSNGSTAGTISYTATTVAYNTSSDYRLKENIAPMTGALAKVSALKPVTYTWKVDGSNGQGFIAHELQAVVPDCVTGEKDAVDADGNPVYQGIDTSFLVATLTAAIQEQQVIITSLEARLTALESK